MTSLLSGRVIFCVYSRVTAVKYHLDYRQFMTDLLMIFRSVSNLLMIYKYAIRYDHLLPLLSYLRCTIHAVYPR